MERGKGRGIGNSLDNGHGVGNGIERGRVDIVVDGVDMRPGRAGVPSATAAAEGNAKMEHHQWYPTTQ